MKKVSNLIYSKGNTVITIESTETVLDALKLMVEKNAGALIVYREGAFAGLMTERDYARKLILKGKHSDETAVSEIMDAKPATVKLDDSIELCMELMADKRIRYLPVLADSHVVGIVSMGDVVRFIMDDQKNTILHLQNFISGGL